MKKNKTFSGTAAEALARDYEDMCPEVSDTNKPNTMGHIIGGIIIATIVVIIISVMVVTATTPVG